MNKLKMNSDEAVCDYCHIRYPDERALKFHEVIHLDDDIDTYLKCSGILSESDHLPRAKRILPYGIRNNRSFQINHRKVVSRNGKVYYSKVFDVSEAIDELLDLCKKYPLRESNVVTGQESPEYDDASIAGKLPIYLCSPPNNSTSTSVCSSDYEASSLSSPSIESGSDDSESDHIKARYEEEKYIRGPPIPISNKKSFCDRELSLKELSSKIIVEDSNSSVNVVVSQSVIEIIDIMENLVSEIGVVGDDHSKSSSAPDKLKTIIENTSDHTSGKSGVEAPEKVDETVIIDNSQFQIAPDSQEVDRKSLIASESFDKMIIDKNLQIQNVPDPHTTDKLSFEVSGLDDKNAMIVENHQVENVAVTVYSMPIIC